MQRLFYYLWLAIMALFLSAYAQAIKADELHVLDLREFNFDVWKIGSNYVGHGQYNQPDRGFGGETWRGGVAANFNLDLCATDNWGLKWDNTIHTEGTNQQVRTVGWQWRAAFQLGPKFDIYYYHHSQHIMDDVQPIMEHFPLQDYYGVRFTLYKRSVK